MGSYPTFVDPTLQGAFEEIDRTLLASTATSISFSGIDSAFKMFRLTGIINGAAANLDLRYNNDAGANYALQTMTANGGLFTGAGSYTQVQHRISLVALAAALSVLICKQVAGTRASMVGQIGATTTGPVVRAEFFGGYWNDTGALIDRIDLLHTTFGVDTVVVLEGDQTT